VHKEREKNRGKENNLERTLQEGAWQLLYDKQLQKYLLYTIILKEWSSLMHN
jgi:hypothetical protein